MTNHAAQLAIIKHVTRQESSNQLHFNRPAMDTSRRSPVIEDYVKPECVAVFQETSSALIFFKGRKYHMKYTNTRAFLLTRYNTHTPAA